LKRHICSSTAGLNWLETDLPMSSITRLLASIITSDQHDGLDG
jgi:hypothetical protein